MVGRVVSGAARAANSSDGSGTESTATSAHSGNSVYSRLRSRAKCANLGKSRQVEFNERVFRIMVTASDDSDLRPIGERVRKDDGRPQARPVCPEVLTLDSVLALRNVKELAAKLDVPYDTNHGWPILWRGDDAWVCEPYPGSDADHIDCPGMPEVIPRAQAIQQFASCWDDYTHFGDVPQRPTASSGGTESAATSSADGWLKAKGKRGRVGVVVPNGGQNHAGQGISGPNWFLSFMEDQPAEDIASDLPDNVVVSSVVACSAARPPKSVVK